MVLQFFIHNDYRTLCIYIYIYFCSILLYPLSSIKNRYAVAFEVTMEGVYSGGMHRRTETLANRSIGRQERIVMAALDKATHDIHAAIDQEEWKQERVARIQNTHSRRTYEERELFSKTILFFWRKFKERLIHSALLMLRQKLLRQLTRTKPFGRFISRLMPREREKAKTAFLQCLMDPFFNKHGKDKVLLIKLPDDWPKRDNICCPVCVFQYIEEGNLRTTKRHRSRKPHMFAAVKSRPYSMSDHIHSCHTDGKSSRACIGCDRGQGVCRPNEKGCLVHQLV